MICRTWISRTNILLILITVLEGSKTTYRTLQIVDLNNRNLKLNENENEIDMHDEVTFWQLDKTQKLSILPDFNSTRTDRRVLLILMLFMATSVLR